MNLAALKKKALWVRQKSFQLLIGSGRGHVGGALSCVEILVALYYGGVLRIEPSTLKSEDRDRFLFSKGHSCLSFYCVLADRGFFPMTELDKFGQNGAIFGGHPDQFIPGVETISGSLGHGLGVGSGLAWAAKMNGKKYLTVVLTGDAECNEGSVWESVSFAAVRKLGNLVAIVDNNQIGASDFIKNFSDGSPLEEKWRSFGWEVRGIDGHNFEEIMNALADMHTREPDKPLAIIAHTIKGKGISFMENDPHWHHGVPTGELLTKAKQELQLEE